MRTSVFREILDHSINGKKIYGGPIDWVTSITADNLTVPSDNVPESGEGTGSINGSAFNIGQLVPINSISAQTVISIGDILYNNGKSLIDLSENYDTTKTQVDYLISRGLGSLTPFQCAQLANINNVISTPQWAKLGTMQDVSSGAAVTFGAMIAAGLNCYSYNIQCGTLISASISTGIINASGSITSVASVNGASSTITHNITSVSGNIIASAGDLSAPYGFVRAENVAGKAVDAALLYHDTIGYMRLIDYSGTGNHYFINSTNQTFPTLRLDFLITNRSIWTPGTRITIFNKLDTEPINTTTTAHPGFQSYRASLNKPILLYQLSDNSTLGSDHIPLYFNNGLHYDVGVTSFLNPCIVWDLMLMDGASYKSGGIKYFYDDWVWVGLNVLQQST